MSQNYRNTCKILVDKKGRNIDVNGNLTDDRKAENSYRDEFNKKLLEGSNYHLTHNPLFYRF